MSEKSGRVKNDEGRIVLSIIDMSVLPINDLIVKSILNRGTFYYPASAHYGGAMVVSCDLCRRSNLTACIGFDKYDLCLTCVERTTSAPSGLMMLRPPMPEAPTTLIMQDSVVTKMMQDSVRFPATRIQDSVPKPMTFMVQDSVRFPATRIQDSIRQPMTYMMQDSVVRRREPVARMMQDSVRRELEQESGFPTGFPTGF